MRVLVLAPHPDDEVLGAGGLIRRLASHGHTIDLVTFSGRSITHYEDERMEWVTVDNVPDAHEAGEILGVDSFHPLDFEMARFNMVPHFEMNRALTELELEPDLILTSSPKDANWDHEIVFRTALVLGRPTERQVSILGFEIGSSTEWGHEPFNPTYYVDISDVLDTKVRAMSVYENEVREFPHPRSPEAIRTKARQRGTEAGYEAAEAFELIRGFPESIPTFDS